MESITVQMTVNGEVRQTKTFPSSTLLYLLRDNLGLFGTKDGCREGECGACTVLLDGKPVNSCLVLAGQADGHEVVTIEGLAQKGELHPIQESFVEAGAVQCGFCTPGLIMSAYALLGGNPNPTENQIREALVGNLCRCTGYTKVVRAVQMAAQTVGA